MLHISLFGTTAVHDGDRRLGVGDFNGVKPRQVLEILALATSRPVTSAAIAEDLWAGRPPQGWTVTLPTYVAVLRRLLQPGVPGRHTVVATVPGGYQLAVRDVDLDVHAVDRLLADADRRPPAEALGLWERACGIADRDLLEHEPYAAWAERARSAFRQRAGEAAVRAAQAAITLAEPDRASALAGYAVRRDPLLEEGWQTLIRAHLQAGRRASAVRALRDCRDALQAELGIEPDPRTLALIAAA